jgi:hypothetical protein
MNPSRVWAPLFVLLFMLVAAAEPLHLASLVNAAALHYPPTIDV